MKLCSFFFPLALVFSFSGCALIDDLKDPVTDEDGDGWSEVYGDCDDSDAGINPDGVEGDICDGQDNNCDGDIDEGLAHTFFPDADGDGSGDASAEGSAGCFAESMVSTFVENNGDCDDADSAVNPDASEVCDGLDNDCDGTADMNAVNGTAWYVDVDGDGWGDDAEVLVLCMAIPGGYSAALGDCDDEDADINPDAADVCGDDIDSDCDGVDETCP